MEPLGRGRRSLSVTRVSRGRVSGRMRHNGPDVVHVTVSIPIVFILNM